MGMLALWQAGQMGVVHMSHQLESLTTAKLLRNHDQEMQAGHSILDELDRQIELEEREHRRVRSRRTGLPLPLRTGQEQDKC